MQHHKGFRVCLTHLPNILIFRYFYYTPILILHSCFLDLDSPLGHVLAHELIVEIKVIFHFVDFVDFFPIELLFEGILFLMFLLGLELDFGERLLLFHGQVVTVLDLQIEPLGVDAISH